MTNVIRGNQSNESEWFATELSPRLPLECLLQEIGRLLGKDASYLGVKITILSRKGQQPNWSAEIGVVSTIELSAFRQVLINTRAMYNLDYHDAR